MRSSENFLKSLLLIITLLVRTAVCQGPPIPSRDDTQSPLLQPDLADVLKPRHECNIGALRLAWLMGTRIFGFCMRRDNFVQGSHLLMQSNKMNLFLWYGLAFDRADRNSDGQLSLKEFMRVARDYYGRHLGVPIDELEDYYNRYLHVNGTSNRATVQQGIYDIESEKILRREWDLMNKGRDIPCLSHERYMDGVCKLAIRNSHHSFKMYDMNENGIVSREEFRNTTTTLRRNDATEELQWRLLDANRNGNIDEREMLLFSVTTLQVL